MIGKTINIIRTAKKIFFIFFLQPHPQPFSWEEKGEIKDFLFLPFQGFFYRNLPKNLFLSNILFIIDSSFDKQEEFLIMTVIIFFLIAILTFFISFLKAERRA